MNSVAILLICCAASVLGGPKPPSWLKATYKVNGTLQLPYAEINEPFISYYKPKDGKSRIDYYGGMVVTIQQAGTLDSKDYGTSYKVAPITTDKVTNQPTCFQINGTSDNRIDVQGVLPDLTNFTLVTTDSDKAQVWQLVTVEGGKKNTYTMWISSDANGNAVPLRYEMMGYDSLLGSHFDKYVVVYDVYENNPKFDDDTFQPDKALVCGDFPTPPGRSHDHLFVDPIGELVHNNDQHFKPSFDKFKHQHGKEYKEAREHKQREHNFRHNLRFIHSHNRAGLGYTVAVNHLADKTPAEISALRGYRPSQTLNSGRPFDKSQHTAAIPDNLDWRLYGAVTQVKDQAVCGSCWSFGSAGAVEGAYFLATKKLVRLSQQALIDCSWGEGNNGCDGGEDFRSYDWIMKNGGLPSEEDYGHYLGQDGMCHVNKVSVTAKVESYVNVTSGDVEALRQALAAHGPAQVSIDASHRSFSFYSNGVYYDPACKNGPMDLDHSVLAVGYGVLEVNGEQQPYWLVKNSWSTYWGNDGYVLMSSKDNNCGVATAASYVNIKN